jgi:hypothetical protein
LPRSLPETDNRTHQTGILGIGRKERGMAYHIAQIVNDSPKSVLLTNPKALRDRHLVTKNSSLRLEYPPLIESIREKTVFYETAVTKTLNIYTTKNNWCFWDNGSNTALLLLGEGGEMHVTLVTDSFTDLKLIVDYDGIPTFAPV